MRKIGGKYCVPLVSAAAKNNIRLEAVSRNCLYVFLCALAENREKAAEFVEEFFTAKNVKYTRINGSVTCSICYRGGHKEHDCDACSLCLIRGHFVKDCRRLGRFNFNTLNSR